MPKRARRAGAGETQQPGAALGRPQSESDVESASTSIVAAVAPPAPAPCTSTGADGLISRAKVACDRATSLDLPPGSAAGDRPLSPRVRADVAEAWAVLGLAGPSGAASSAPQSRAQLQGALREMWAENERRRRALCVLFSKHADLAPEAAKASTHGTLQSVHAAAGAYARSSLSLFGPGSSSQLPFRSQYLAFKRNCRGSLPGDGPRLELDRLPDALLSYIYSFAPNLVLRDLAVSKRFSTCLLKTERVVLDVKCGSDVTEASLMRFGQGVELIGKRCWGLAEKLTSALASGWSGLVVLDLSDNELDDDSIKLLSEALQQRNTNLTSLSLCDNTFTGIGASHLGEALSRFVSLRKLSLNGNRIGPVGARHIASGLERQQGVMTRMTHLGLGGSAIGAEGIRALVPVFVPPGARQDGSAGKAQADSQPTIDKGGVLRKLDLSACALGPDGMEALQPLLKVRARARMSTCACLLACARMTPAKSGASCNHACVGPLRASPTRLPAPARHRSLQSLYPAHKPMLFDSGTPVSANFRCRGTN
jgi:hypothetical protein